MRYYPVFLDLEGKTVVFSGAGETAVAKLRLLLKTSARIRVFGREAAETVQRWDKEGRVEWTGREITQADLEGATLFYCAEEDEAQRVRSAALGRAAGVLTNIVDNLQESEFLTPAIVDRDPVIVAIGTEGTAPVLARSIKARIEAMLPVSTGILARIGDTFRSAIASLPSRSRRELWARFFENDGPEAFAEAGENGARAALAQLVARFSGKTTNNEKPGHVALVGAGPGDPELLTLKARKALHDADVVLHDRLVSAEILELARREALLVPVGKTGFDASMKQEDINALLVEHAAGGARVVRLKGGDPAVFGRVDEEIEALDAAGIAWSIIPGITAASAAVAASGASLTRRGRNTSIQILTGHDVEGFADHDWARLAKPGNAAAIYMGVTAARYIAGRLLMHGADAGTPVAIATNVSLTNQTVTATTLDGLARLATEGRISGPSVILYGIEARRASQALGETATATDREAV